LQTENKYLFVGVSRVFVGVLRVFVKREEVNFYYCTKK